MNKLKLLVEKKQQLKQLQEEIKQLEAELLQEGIEEEKVDNFIVKKVVRLSYKLKPDIDELEVKRKYPDAVKIVIDTKALVKEWAEEYLEEKETAYLQVKEIK